MRTISPAKLRALADLMQRRREALGISAREAARRSEMHVSSYLRIERGEQSRPSTQSLNALAEALELPASDLFAALGWLPEDELPSLTPYLRTKYHELPEKAVHEMATYFRQLARKYDLSDGPGPGEDEI